MSAPADDAKALEIPPPAGMRVLRGLGHGGMGAVWLVERALHGGLTQRVVIKRPRVDVIDGVARTTDSLAQRFRNEGRALARVSHGNVVRLLDAGADAHGPWLAIEHVDGLDGHALLEALRKCDARITADEVAWIAHEAARGMAAAHALLDADGEPSPILHRDLSPQNLLLSRAGEVKVTDFGIAWAVDRDARTTTGVVVGNLRYIAPEQLEGRSVGPTTDVYGLGRVVEEYLELTEDSPARASLRAVAQRATRRDPDERHGSMDALSEALLDAVPTLCHGRARLAARVCDATRARDRVHHALAGLLAAERPDNDRVSLPVAASGATPSPAPPSPAPRPLEAPPEVPVSVAPAAVTAARAETSRARRPTALALSLTGGAALALWIALVPRQTQRAPRVEPPPSPTTSQGAPQPPPTPVIAPPTTPPSVPPAPTATSIERAPGPAATREELHHAVVRHGRTVPVELDASAQIEAPASATLRVNALPFARVSIDGSDPVGTPHAFTLRAGVHHLRARFTVDGGIVELAQDVELAAGETRTLGLVPR
ncbi:MAG: serine/threonine-protein kinase [Polyangiales bacterium]